jgi:hypothetical protein
MSFIKGTAIVVAGAGLLFIAGAASAQSVEVSVPFDFQVNGVTLPAGHYDLETNTTTGIVVLHGDRGTTGGAVVLTTPADGRDPAGNKPSLTFSRYEAGYRLSGIWESGTDGRSVLTR